MSGNWQDVPCHLHRASIRGKGYGQAQDPIRKRQGYAHVIAWETANGRAVPDGMVVMHKCDVRLCDEPLHLTLGTVADNNRDMREKGRGAIPPPQVGSKNYGAKLSESDVLEMRRLWSLGVALVQLGSMFHVHCHTARRIVNRKLWRHI